MGRTDEPEAECLLARLLLAEDTGLADVQQDLGGELDLVDKGQTERELHGEKCEAPAPESEESATTHLEDKVDPAVKVKPAEARLLDLVVLVRNCGRLVSRYRYA